MATECLRERERERERETAYPLWDLECCKTSWFGAPPTLLKCSLRALPGSWTTVKHNGFQQRVREREREREILHLFM
jgi:hypothetical protein